MTGLENALYLIAVIVNLKCIKPSTSEIEIACLHMARIACSRCLPIPASSLASRPFLTCADVSVNNGGAKD